VSGVQSSTEAAEYEAEVKGSGVWKSGGSTGYDF